MTDNTEEKLAILRKVEYEFEKDKGEAYTLLGRFEAFNFSKRFLEFSELKTIERIKERKAYKDLWVTDKKTGEKKKINTLKEFCESLGVSYDTVNNHLNYLQNLGEPLYRESQRLGVSNREMRRLIKLPTEAITEIAKQDYSEDDDKTRLLATLSEYELTIEKQAEALKEIQQKLEERDQNYEALSRVTENKDKRINQLDLELQKSKKLIEDATPDEYVEKLREDVTHIGWHIETKLRGSLYQGFKLLLEHSEKTGISHKQIMSGILAQFQATISELKFEFGINDQPSDSDLPEWAREDYAGGDYTGEYDVENDEGMKAILNAEILG